MINDLLTYYKAYDIDCRSWNFHLLSDKDTTEFLLNKNLMKSLDFHNSSAFWSKFAESANLNIESVKLLLDGIDKLLIQEQLLKNKFIANNIDVLYYLFNKNTQYVIFNNTQYFILKSENISLETKQKLINMAIKEKIFK